MKNVGYILGIIFLLLKRKFTKNKRRKNINKNAEKDIRRFDEALAKGDMDSVARKFIELRRDILRETTFIH